MKPCVLVIGYGNELRRDDGVGPCVARAAAAWNLPGLRALSVHQLTPELAEELAVMDRVIFIDAAAEGHGPEVRTLVPAAAGAAALGHAVDPRRLLGLTAALHGRAPMAWLITAPAADLGHGEGLSPEGERAAAEALCQLELLLRNQAGWCDRNACFNRGGPCPWELVPLSPAAGPAPGPSRPRSEAE
jgi:hydrogenase maturation protease